MQSVDLSKLFPVERPRVPGGRWLVGFSILGALLAFFAACGVFTQAEAPRPHASYGAALFFSVNIAYIVPIVGYISERTMAAVAALAPSLEADRQTIDGWRQRVFRKPVRWLITVLTIGALSGLMHNLLLYPSATVLVRQIGNSPAIAAVVAGTLLIWLVLTTSIAALLDNAVMLNHAARRVRLQPFDTHRLRPFASIAVISTLGIVGAQATFPVMSIESGLNPLAYIPGLLGTGVPMLLIAALPVWPVHRRLAVLKHGILNDLNHRIGAMPLPDPERPESLSRLTPLLAYRREVAQVSEWPFDVGVLTRLGLYLIIPPLTWVGAAIIEHVVDNLL